MPILHVAYNLLLYLFLYLEVFLCNYNRLIGRSSPFLLFHWWLRLSGHLVDIFIVR